MGLKDLPNELKSEIVAQLGSEYSPSLECCPSAEFQPPTDLLHLANTCQCWREMCLPYIFHTPSFRLGRSCPPPKVVADHCKELRVRLDHQMLRCEPALDLAPFSRLCGVTLIHGPNPPVLGMTVMALDTRMEPLSTLLKQIHSQPSITRIHLHGAHLFEGAPLEMHPTETLHLSYLHIFRPVPSIAAHIICESCETLLSLQRTEGERTCSGPQGLTRLTLRVLNFSTNHLSAVLMSHKSTLTRLAITDCTVSLAAKSGQSAPLIELPHLEHLTLRYLDRRSANLLLDSLAPSPALSTLEICAIGPVPFPCPNKSLKGICPDQAQLGHAVGAGGFPALKRIRARYDALAGPVDTLDTMPLARDGLQILRQLCRKRRVDLRLRMFREGLVEMTEEDF